MSLEKMLRSGFSSESKVSLPRDNQSVNCFERCTNQLDKLEGPVRLLIFARAISSIFTVPKNRLTRILSSVKFSKPAKYNQEKLLMPSDVIPNTISYLIVQVSKAHRNRASGLLQDLDIHLGQEMLLQCLWQQDKQTQTELANRLSIRLATVNRMVNRMEKAQLVSKCADEEDGRVSRVQLTETGREVQESIEHVWEKLEEQTLADFSQKETDLLRRLLLQMIENLT